MLGPYMTFILCLSKPQCSRIEKGPHGPSDPESVAFSDQKTLKLRAKRNSLLNQNNNLLMRIIGFGRIGTEANESRLYFFY
jgi:hypothetical protein